MKENPDRKKIAVHISELLIIFIVSSFLYLFHMYFDLATVRLWSDIY